MTDPTAPDEDEAFNELERLSKLRQELIRRQMEPVKTQQLRNGVIEEVAQHIEKLTGFGQDTISSFAIYIRGMKK